MIFAVLAVPLALSVAAPTANETGDVAKQVISTPWWPPGSEKQAESVGILSYGLVFMTGMMEVNATLEASTQQELYDVRDIAKAGGAGMEDLVDCLINTPKGAAKAIRESFEAALPVATRPPLTVVEMPGEYVFCPTSVTCVAAQPDTGAGRLRRFKRAGASGVAARGFLHMQGKAGTPGSGAKQEVVEALEAIEGLVRDAGGAGLAGLLDCTAFLRRISDAAAVRSTFAAAHAEPALTVVQAGLEDTRRSIVLRCVAAVPGGMSELQEVRRTQTDSGLATTSDRFIFASGQLGIATNGTDAFQSLERLLKAAGASLSDVVNCVFYVKETGKVFDLFAGFSQVFNKNHPPPPSRTEFTAMSECAGCAVVAKCIAARRPSDGQPLLDGGDVRQGLVLV